MDRKNVNYKYKKTNMSARAQDVKTSEEEYMHMYKTVKCITKKENNSALHACHQNEKVFDGIN